MINSGVKQAYDSLSGEYDALFGPASMEAWKGGILKLINETELRNRTVLDIACGTGCGGQLMRKYAPARLVGLDVSQGMLRVAYGRYDEIIRGDMLRLPFSSDAFDLITCGFDSVNHLTFDQLTALVNQISSRRIARIFCFDVLTSEASAFLMQHSPIRGEQVMSCYAAHGSDLVSTHTPVSVNSAETNWTFAHHLFDVERLNRILGDAGLNIDRSIAIRSRNSPQIPGNYAYRCAVS